MQFAEEKIKVKGDKDVILKVKITHHGPIIEPGLINYISEDVSFMWALNHANQTAFSVIFNIMNARNLTVAR